MLNNVVRGLAVPGKAELLDFYGMNFKSGAMIKSNSNPICGAACNGPTLQTTFISSTHIQATWPSGQTGQTGNSDSNAGYILSVINTDGKVGDAGQVGTSMAGDVSGPNTNADQPTTLAVTPIEGAVGTTFTFINDNPGQSAWKGATGDYWGIAGKDGQVFLVVQGNGHSFTMSSTVKCDPTFCTGFYASIPISSGFYTFLPFAPASHGYGGPGWTVEIK